MKQLICNKMELQEKLWLSFEKAEEQIDYEAVRKAMNAVRWTYFDSFGKTPTVENLKEMVKDLFKDALTGIFNSKEHDWWCSSGGWLVIVDCYGDVRIIFAFEESDSY